VAARTLGSVLLAKGDVAGAESALLDWHKAMGQTPEAWLVLGDFHLATRQWDKANDAWRRVADPALAPSVAVRQARVLEAQGKPDDAETRLRSALAATPTHEEVLIALSQRLLARGQVPEGLTHAQTALRTHPLSAASATQLAEAMRAANDEFAAYELFKRAVLRDPQNVAALVGASSVARAIGDAESAVNYAREAVGVLPRAPEARLALAQAYRARGDLDAAGREILQVYSAAPTLPAVALEAAALLQQRGRHADARAVYDALLVSSPTSEEALAGVVSTYLAENQAARAIERLESRGLKRPDHPGWMRLRAAAAQGAGDTRLARSLLEAAIERDPDDYNTYVLLGTMLADQGALGEARRHFTTLVQRQPRPVGPWTMLGIVAEMGGDQAEAERCYRAAIAIDRKAAVASNNLAYLLAGRENQTGEALTLAETALARLPRRAEVVDTVGWVHLKAGTPRSAVSRFEQARQLAPGEPVYSYHAALAYEQLRDVERARTLVVEALASARPFPERGDADALARRLGTSGSRN
jgi:tetratricopeptide (TPR) repeat protein